MGHLAIIALGGACGALARYGVSRTVNRLTGGIFPWGTLAVNLAGLFIIGFLFELFERRVVPSELRTMATIGFLGALTTFSTYGLETLNLLRDGEIRLGLWNMLLHNGAGLLCVVAGVVLARFLIR